MGQEVVYCSICRKQLRSSDFERKAAFRVGGQSACSPCAPDLLKRLPSDQIQGLLSQLGGEKSPSPASEPRPSSTRRVVPGPGTERRLASITPFSAWAIAGFLGVAGLFVGVLVVSGRSEKSESATLKQPDVREPKPSLRPQSPGTTAPESPGDPLREARDFARENPKDLSGQFARYEKALRATEQRPNHDEARREYEAFVAKLRSSMGETLSALEGPLRSAITEEKFSDALDLLSKSGARYPAREWQSISSDQARLIRESAAGRYAILKEQALQARQRGAENEVKTIRERVAAWGLADLAGALESALGRVAAPESEGPANPGVAKKAEPLVTKKDEKPVDSPAPAPDASPLPPKSPPVPPEKNEALRVDEAIRRGIGYLKGAGSPGWEWWNGIKNSHELILLTFIHSELVPESDPKFQEYFKEMMAAPPQRTYSAALQAMVLEELDRVKYQGRIAQCAQYLIDTQCTDGQWSYGTNLDLPEFRGSSDPKKDVATPAKLDASGRRVKPKVTRKITIAKRRDGPAGGDNSNAQYAALGLRACHDSGIVIPRETLDRAIRWWRESQQAEEKSKGMATGTGETGLGRGWGYDPRSPLNGLPTINRSYAAMTAGGTGSLIILDHLMGMDWKKDPAVKAGIRWMATHFSAEENVGIHEAYKDFEAKHWLYYCLYAIERLGILADAPKLGPHEWYPKGAEVILRSQAADGSWNADHAPNQPSEWETCLSILFLKRATRPLVASEDRVVRPDQK